MIEPASIASTVPIKEGVVEKRGHSAKYLIFSRYMLLVVYMCKYTFTVWFVHDDLWSTVSRVIELINLVCA